MYVLFTSCIFLLCPTQCFIIRINVEENPRAREEMESITCWTCPGKSNNEECNDWAPDRQCHKSHSWCKTVHRFNERSGKSILVNKECVQARHCSVDHVGCYQTLQPNVIDCVTCCNRDYCNEFVPVNHTSALEQSSYFHLSSDSGSIHYKSNGWIAMTFLIIAILFFVIS